MIGEMKHRVTAMTKKKVPSGRGGWTIEEIEIGTFWAKIEDLTARNIIQYRQADLNTNTRIIMRANDQITKECVFYAKGYRYNLEEVIEKDGFFTIMAVGEKING